MAESVLHVAAGSHRVFQPQPGMTLVLLHVASAYQVSLVEVEPHTRCSSPAHDGEELRYVLSGTVIFEIGAREQLVSAGGTLRHASSTAHGFRTEAEPARFVTFALSRDYDLAALMRGLAEAEG